MSTPWRSLLITLSTAFAVAGLLLLRHPSAEAAAPPPLPPPFDVATPPAAPPPVVVAVATPASEPDPTPAANPAPAHKKKKHVSPLSREDQTRRALRDLQRAQLVRATGAPSTRE